MTVYVIHVNRAVLVCAPNSAMWALLRIPVIVRMRKQCVPGIFSSLASAHSCLVQPLSFPTVFADFQAANLRDTIVYRDIKIYCSNVKTLRFLEKLRSASATHFTL